MANNPGFAHINMDECHEVAGQGSNASAPSSHAAVANNGQPLNLSSTQAGHGMPTSSVPNEGVANHHEYGADSQSSSEVDESSEYDADMTDEATEPQYSVLQQGGASANASSHGLESGDEIAGDKTVSTFKAVLHDAFCSLSRHY